MPTGADSAVKNTGAPVDAPETWLPSPLPPSLIRPFLTEA